LAILVGVEKKVYPFMNLHLLGFALGIEVEILFVLDVQSEVEGRQAQKDCNEKPARTPNDIS